MKKVVVADDEVFGRMGTQSLGSSLVDRRMDI